MTLTGIIITYWEGKMITRSEIHKLTTHQLATLAGTINTELALRLAPPPPDADVKLAPGERLSLMQFGKRTGDTVEKVVRDLYAKLEPEMLQRMERVFVERDANREQERADLANEIAAAFRASAPAKGKKVKAKVAVTVDNYQHLLCTKCNKTWSRPAKQGRPPKVCPSCS